MSVSADTIAVDVLNRGCAPGRGLRHPEPPKSSVR